MTRRPAPPALKATTVVHAARALAAALGVAMAMGVAGPAASQGQLEMLQRMESLELTIQRLTAQVEQLTFENRAAQRRTDARLQDMEFRLIELEGGDPTEALRQPQPQPLGAAPDPAPAATPPPDVTPPPRTPPAQAANPQDAPAVAQPTAPGPTAPGPAPLGTLRGAIQPAERAAFDAARRDLETEGPTAGRDSFAAFLTDHPDSALAGEAQNLLGQAYAREGRHQEAARSFLIGVRDYGQTPKATENLLGLAAALTDLGRQAEACSALAEMAARFPDAAPSVKARAVAEARRAGCS